MDHPDSVPKLERFPLIVDLLVRTTRFTKALMDGGSGLNLMYLNTFVGLGLTLDQLQSSPHTFYRVVLGKQFIPLMQVTLLSPSETLATTTPKLSFLRWSTTLGPTTSSWGSHVT
jgi:hypothetical protein